MIRDQHFTVFDGICGRTCRFSIPKRKHFHCKYCDWACCAVSFRFCFSCIILTVLQLNFGIESNFKVMNKVSVKYSGLFVVTFGYFAGAIHLTDDVFKPKEVIHVPLTLLSNYTSDSILRLGSFSLVTREM